MPLNGIQSRNRAISTVRPSSGRPARSQRASTRCASDPAVPARRTGRGVAPYCAGRHRTGETDAAGIVEQRRQYFCIPLAVVGDEASGGSGIPQACRVGQQHGLSGLPVPCVEMDHRIAEVTVRHGCPQRGVTVGMAMGSPTIQSSGSCPQSTTRPHGATSPIRRYQPRCRSHPWRPDRSAAAEVQRPVTSHSVPPDGQSTGTPNTYGDWL